MLKVQELRVGIIRPTLKRIEAAVPRIAYKQEVEDLLVMIAAHESHLGKYRRQVGGGPARGIYQIEIPTHLDLYENYLFYREDYLGVISSFTPQNCDLEDELEKNDRYSTAVARFLLWRVPEAIPSLDDFKHSGDPLGAYYWNLALYAKTHWNTEGGAATPEKYLNDFLRLT